jgi:hypothetical protein
MWAMMYFRTLPSPLRDLDPDFLEIFYNFANTYTEESVLRGYTKNREKEELGPTEDQMKNLGYSDEEIAGMDLRGEV